MSRKDTRTKRGALGAAAEPSDVERALLAAIVESSEDAIISKTLEGVITSWNAAAERLYGYTAEEAVGRHISLIVPKELSAQLEEIHGCLRRGEKVRHLETMRVRKDGSRVEVAVSISPVRNAAGVIVGASTIARDISARRSAEQERARLAAQVEDERRRLRDLVGSVPGVVWEAWGEPDEASQRINFVSDYVEQMLGYTVDEWLSTPNFWLTIVHPEDREHAARSAREKFESPAGGVSEFRWVRKDGRVIHVEAHSVVVRDEAGRPAGMRGVTMDISARKEAEEAARESAEQFRTLADSIPQLTWMADPSGSIFWYNRRWYDYTGTTFEEMQGWGWQQVHHPEDVARVTARFRSAIAAGEPWEDTFPLRGRDGEYRRFLSRAVPMRDAAGRILRWFGTNTDIEEQKQAEAMLARLSEERERMLEEVSTPVVPVLEGVLVLPLIGSLDTVRTQRATQAALAAVTAQGARVCIIDITGARMVDSHAVANLTNLVQALQLVGAEAFVTGVGAQVAQTLVHLGLDMRGLRTYRTLAQVLAALLDGGGRRAQGGLNRQNSGNKV